MDKDQLPTGASNVVRHYKIILPDREIFIQAASKGLSTEEAIKSGKMEKFDCFDVEDILEITSVEYLRGIGQPLEQ